MNGPRVRFWRCAFVGYAVALAIGTHWPRIDLGSAAGMPDPDKIAHFVAFAGLAFLLWRTQWVPDPRLWAALLLGWPVLDEVTQALPILGRSTSWQDVLAGQLGVIVVVAWRGLSERMTALLQQRVQRT
ncbi:MAG: VanZ family protein [Planctomycetota bacterium]|jgi:VanZ family protein